MVKGRNKSKLGYYKLTQGLRATSEGELERFCVFVYFKVYHSESRKVRATGGQWPGETTLYIYI